MRLLQGAIHGRPRLSEIQLATLVEAVTDREQTFASSIREREDGLWEVVAGHSILARFPDHLSAVDFRNGYNCAISRRPQFKRVCLGLWVRA